MTALVMAGGKGTRMNVATEKPLLEVGGKSMIEHVVVALKRSKVVDRIIVAVTKKHAADGTQGDRIEQRGPGDARRGLHI